MPDGVEVSKFVAPEDVPNAAQQAPAKPSGAKEVLDFTANPQKLEVHTTQSTSADGTNCTQTNTTLADGQGHVVGETVSKECSNEVTGDKSQSKFIARMSADGKEVHVSESTVSDVGSTHLEASSSSHTKELKDGSVQVDGALKVQESTHEPIEAPVVAAPAAPAM